MEATADSKRNTAQVNNVEVNADSSVNQKKQVTFNKKRESSEEETETISAQQASNSNNPNNNHESYQLQEIDQLGEIYSPFHLDGIEAHFEDDIVNKKKQMRKAQMKRRLDFMLDSKDSAQAAQKDKNEIILATSPKIDIGNLTKAIQSASRESEHSNRQDEANSSQQSHEFLSDCISQNDNQPETANKAKNMTASKINETDHLEKPVASILKQPTGISNKDKDNESQFQKQSSIKFRKQVSISEEPRVIQQDRQLALVNGQQSEGTMFSVSSLENDNNKNMSKERPSVTEQFQEDKHSIISEEDSAFEEQTPKDNRYAHGKMFSDVRRSQDVNEDFSSSIKRKPDKLNIQRKKTNPQKIVKTNQASSEMIIVVDDRKQKVKRIQTMENEQQKTKSKFQKNIQGSPSFTKVHDQDKNSQISKCNSLYSNKRDIEKSGHLKMENLMVPNMYRKQATQDHRDRKGRQRKFVSPEEQVLTTGRKSRNTSLNLTVDNQLDHLSVNFGRKGDKDQAAVQGANLSVLSGLSSNKKGKFTSAKRGRQIDQILATSKHNIPPHSHDKFVRKNYVRSSHQSQVRQSIRSRVSQDDKSVSHDFSSSHGGARRAINEDLGTSSLKNGSSPNQERPGLDINARLNKANRKMIQIYQKTPYQVKFYNPIMSLHSQSKGNTPLQTQRLYQAENQLKISKNIHLMSRPKKSHIKHQDQRGEHKMSTGRRGTVTSNKNLSPEMAKYARQYTNTSKGKQERDYGDLARGRKTSIQKLTQQNIVDPQSSASVFSNVQNVNYSLNGTEIDKNYRKSLSFTEKTKTDKSTQDQAFRLKFYDQLINHIDRRLQNCKGQLTQIKKQKDICDIYGQTLQSINFGDTPYTSVNYGFHKQSTFTSGIRQTAQVDADKLKPIVGATQVRTSSRFSNRNEKSAKKLDINQEKKMSILESQDHTESEMVVQESARTNKSKTDQNPMNSEEISVAEAQDEINPRNVTRIGDHMLQPSSEIEALENMQQAYLMRRSQDDHDFDKSSYHFTNSQGNISDQFDLLKQIVTMSSKMGFSHQQMHYLKDKHQQLEEIENQLEHQYKNKRFKISPNKKPKRGKKITISNLENKPKKDQERIELLDSKIDEVKTPLFLYYPEPQSQKKIKTEKKGRNLSQYNKTAYQAKIKEHMSSTKNNLVISSKQSAALDEVKHNIRQTINKNNSEMKDLNEQREKAENKLDPSQELLSAHQSVLMQKKLQMDSRQFKKKLDDNQASINNKIQMEIAELRQRQKEKIEIQLSHSKFKRHTNKNGLSIPNHQGDEHQMITQKNVGDLQNYHSSGSKTKTSKTNFIKQNIRNLAPLSNTFYQGQANLVPGTSQQMTPKGSTGSRHPELWGKKQHLAPIEKDWDKSQSQKFNNTQGIQSFQEEVSPVIIKHKNSTSSHYYNSSLQEKQKKNSRLLHSGQQMMARNNDKSYNNFTNNNQKHKTAVSQSHNQRQTAVVGAMRISESNRQLINKYSPRLPQLESDPATFKRKVQQIRNANNLVPHEQRELQAKTTPPPIATSSRSVYQQINQNSLKQQSHYGRSNVNQYKQSEVLRNVIKNQRNLSNRIKTNANSINRNYYPAINNQAHQFNLSNIADKSIAVQQDAHLQSDAPRVSAGPNLRLVNNQSDINQSGSTQFRQENQDVPQYQTLDAHGLPSARNSQNNQNSIPNAFIDTSSQLRTAAKLNAPAQ